MDFSALVSLLVHCSTWHVSDCRQPCAVSGRFAILYQPLWCRRCCHSQNCLSAQVFFGRREPMLWGCVEDHVEESSSTSCESCMFVQICYIISFPKFTAEGFFHKMFVHFDHFQVSPGEHQLNDVFPGNVHKETAEHFDSFQSKPLPLEGFILKMNDFSLNMNDLIFRAQNVPKHWCPRHQIISNTEIRGSLGYFCVAVQQDPFLQGQPHRRGFSSLHKITDPLFRWESVLRQGTHKYRDSRRSAHSTSNVSHKRGTSVDVPRQGCPVVLVLSPTRELAIQTCSEMEVLTKGFPGLPRCHLVAASQTVYHKNYAVFWSWEELWMNMNEQYV